MAQLLTNLAQHANRFLLLVPLFLGACTVGPWEREFWHPPAARGVAPIRDGKAYPIPRATGETLTKWPKLGTVPDRPPPPAPPEDIDAALQQLEADRVAAQIAAQKVNSEGESGSPLSVVRPAGKAGDWAVPVPPSPPPALPE